MDTDKLTIIESSASGVFLKYKSGGSDCPCLEYGNGYFSQEWHSLIDPDAPMCDNGVLSAVSTEIEVYASLQRLSANVVQQLKTSGRVLDIGLIHSNTTLMIGAIKKSDSSWMNMVDVWKNQDSVSIECNGIEYSISDVQRPIVGDGLTFTFLKPRE